MESTRCERDEYATMVSSSECILRDAREIAVSSSTPIPVRNQPLALQPLDAAIQKRAASFQRVDDADKSDGLADRLLSEELPAFRISPGQSSSSSRLANTAHKQIENTPGVVKNVASRLHGDAGDATGSNPGSQRNGVDPNSSQSISPQNLPQLCPPNHSRKSSLKMIGWGRRHRWRGEPHHWRLALYGINGQICEKGGWEMFPWKCWNGSIPKQRK